MEKAKKFLVHLYTTLDVEKGGDITGKAGQLYAFVIQQTNGYTVSAKNLPHDISRKKVSYSA